MKKFKSIQSIPAHIPLMNIDTDMIIPKQFLKTIKRTGLGKNLFYEMRYDENGNLIKGSNWKKFWLWIFKRTCTMGIARFWFYLHYQSKFCRYIL